MTSWASTVTHLERTAPEAVLLLALLAVILVGGWALGAAYDALVRAVRR